MHSKQGKLLITFILTALAGSTQAATWQQIPGSWISVSAAGDGSALAIDASGKLQKWTGTGWTLVADAGRQIGSLDRTGRMPRHQVSGEGAFVYVLDPYTKAPYRLDSTTRTLQKLPGAADSLAVAGDGSAYALAAGALWRLCFCGRTGEAPLNKWMMTSLSAQGLPLDSVTVRSGVMWGHTAPASNQIVRWNPTTLDWDFALGSSPTTPGSLSRLSVGSDGTTIGLSTAGLKRWDSANSQWTKIGDQPPGTLTVLQFSIGNANSIFLINDRDELWAYR
jgi:hypothetical protein